MKRQMKNEKLKRPLFTLAFTSTLLAIGFSFNSCSDVAFSNLTLPVVDLCSSDYFSESDPTCFTNARRVNYDETYQIPPVLNKVDILLVLDNSGSMTEDLKKLASKLDGLVEQLDINQTDWQMCYITTSVSEDDIAGKAREWLAPPTKPNGDPIRTGSIVLRPETANKSDIFFTSIDSLPEKGDGNERGITAIRRAVARIGNEECFRADAALATVIISDEDERSCGGRCKDYPSSENFGGPQYRLAEKYRNQYSPLDFEDDPLLLISYINDELAPAGMRKTYVNHSIVIRKGDYICYDTQDKEDPAFFGLVYSHLQSLTGGILGNICAESYSEQLKSIGARTVEAINSVTLRCAPIEEPVVTLLPEPNPPATWIYSGNKIIFSAPLAQSTRVRVQYTCLER